MAAGSECISSAEAAQLTDIPVHVIEWWKRQGRIEHRPETGGVRPLRLRSLAADTTITRVSGPSDASTAPDQQSSPSDPRAADRLATQR